MKLTKEIKIALVAIVGILVLFFGLEFLKGMSLFSNDNTYYVSFKDISGYALQRQLCIHRHRYTRSD